MLKAATTDTLAAYPLRAEAARMAAPQGAASAASSPEVELRLCLEGLAAAPADNRARLGAVRAAIALRRDSLAIALAQSGAQPRMDVDPEVPYYPRRGRYRQYSDVHAAPVLPKTPINDEERALIAGQLAASAERLDDLHTAQRYLQAAIDLHQTDALVQRMTALTAELDRRAKNASGQPVIKNVIEQDRIVGPRIARSVQ